MLGTPLPGRADGPGTVARFSVPWGIALERQRDLFICHVGKNAIRNVTTAGVVAAVAGPGP